MEDYRVVFEIVGYVGSGLVLASFLMSSVLKLRIINAVGSIVSVAYGLLVHTYPTVLMNAALLAINIYYIIKLSRVKDEKIFKSETVDVNDKTLAFFINGHKADIEKFFPNFVLEKAVFDYSRLFFMEDSIVGVILGKKNKDGSIDILLDYTTPSYRDFSVGKYAYTKLAEDGINKAVFTADLPKSFVYLKKIGFVKGDKYMEKEL